MDLEMTPEQEQSMHALFLSIPELLPLAVRALQSIATSLDKIAEGGLTVFPLNTDE